MTDHRSMEFLEALKLVETLPCARRENLQEVIERSATESKPEPTSPRAGQQNKEITPDVK
nr:MAG: hypothetical protein BECKLFY1418A_GA0070994_101838 [Candidatus Kentron sp. LFY]